jgi:hypothetical protein
MCMGPADILTEELENGAEKRDIFMSYLPVKWNSFGLRFVRRRFRH